VLRGDPAAGGDVPVTVVSFEGVTAEGAGGLAAGSGSLNAALRSRRRKSEMLRIALEPAAGDLALLLDLLRTPVPRRVAIVTRRAALLPAQRAAAAALLEAAPDALVVCAREPYDADCFPQARTLVCTYGDEQISFDGLADVIVGRVNATGTLPVALAGWPLGGGLGAR
jgi:beta-N-acetylhexosaminidase